MGQAEAGGTAAEASRAPAQAQGGVRGAIAALHTAVRLQETPEPKLSCSKDGAPSVQTPLTCTNIQQSHCDASDATGGPHLRMLSSAAALSAAGTCLWYCRQGMPAALRRVAARLAAFTSAAKTRVRPLPAARSGSPFKQSCKE